VNISDHMGFEPWPGFVPHGVSKAGVSAMTHLLAGTLAPRVRVNAVAPGAVLAPEGWPPAEREKYAKATPLAAIGTPGDVVTAVRYLISATYVTGETLFVDGGRHGAR
jgi:pteridine reductase